MSDYIAVSPDLALKVLKDGLRRYFTDEALNEYDFNRLYIKIEGETSGLSLSSKDVGAFTEVLIPKRVIKE